MIDANKETCADLIKEVQFIDEKCDRLVDRNPGLNSRDWRRLRAGLVHLSEFLKACHDVLPSGDGS